MGISAINTRRSGKNGTKKEDDAGAFGWPSGCARAVCAPNDFTDGSESRFDYDRRMRDDGHFVHCLDAFSVQ